MNVLLFIMMLLFGLSCPLIAYKLMKKDGLLIWIAVAIIIANIAEIKCADIFGLSMTLGNVAFASIFLATDILNEKFGSDEAKKGIKIGAFSIITFTLFIQLILLFIPSAEDIMNVSLNNVFNLSIRTSIASVVMYIISNLIDVKLYSYLKNKYPKKLWLRNNVSTIVSQCLENILFVIIAFIGVYDLSFIFELIITMCIIETVIAVCDTPFIYLAKKLK